MSDVVYEALKEWAGIFTWHTGHPIDTKRFHSAMTRVYEDAGPSISEEDLRRALKRHRDENPEGLGGKPSDVQLDEYIEKAVVILSYLEDEGR